MSDEVKPKLNLKALKTIEKVTEEKVLLQKEDTPIQDIPLKEVSALPSLVGDIPGIPEEVEKVFTPAKIAFGTIKKSIEVMPVGEIYPEIIEESIEIKETSIDTDLSGLTVPLIGEEELDAGDKKPSKEILEFIAQEKNGEKEEQAKDIKEVTPVEFQNYESGFKKQSSNVLKRIQNFRYTPKTRTGFLIGLVSLCFGSILLLMVFFPERQALAIYQASIFGNIEKNSVDQNVSQIENPLIPENPITEEENKIDIPDISPEEENVTPPLQEKNTTEVRQEKKEKLRQHLLKKYSS